VLSVTVSGFLTQAEQLQWSRGSVLAFSTRVRWFKPGQSHRIFKGEKILSMPSFGGEVKPSVPCHRFAACKRSLNVTWKSAFRQNYRILFSPIKFHLSLLGSLASCRTWRHLAATVGTSKTKGWQGSTTSLLKAAVQPGHWLRALIYNNNTGWQPHVSRFTLCSPNLNLLQFYVSVLCFYTRPIPTSYMFCCSPVWNKCWPLHCFLFEKLLHTKFLSWVRFLKYCENSRTSNAPFSGIWNSRVKSFFTLEEFIFKQVLPFSCVCKVLQPLFTSDGPALC
jgi:hypothetical protein